MYFLKSVHLKGYKNIRNTSIAFCEGLNIVIGQNGSGKTNFFEFLDDVLRSTERQIWGTNHNSKVLEQLREYDKPVEATVEFSAVTGIKDPKKLKLAFKTLKKPITDSQFSYEIQTDFLDEMDKSNSYEKFDVSLLFCFLRYGLTTSLLGLNSDYDCYFFRKNATEPQNSIIEKILYQNLEQHYLSLAKYYTSFAEIPISELKGHLFAIPTLFLDLLREHTLIKDFKITCNQNILKDKNANEVLRGINSEFFIDNEWWRWDDLSDGTKRLFHILGHIFLQNHGTVIIEEPELGLHPHQLFELMEVIKKIIDVKQKNLQIILTTHAPQLLDCLDINNDLHRIIITQMTDEGTKMRHLTNEQVIEAQQFLENNHLFLRDYWIHAGLEHQSEPL